MEFFISNSVSVFYVHWFLFPLVSKLLLHTFAELYTSGAQNSAPLNIYLKV